MLGSKPNWSLTGGYKIHISSKVSPNNSGVQRLCAHPIVPICPSSFPLFIPGHWISPRYSSWCLAAWEPCNHLDSAFVPKHRPWRVGKWAACSAMSFTISILWGSLAILLQRAVAIHDIFDGLDFQGDSKVFPFFAKGYFGPCSSSRQIWVKGDYGWPPNTVRGKNVT